MIERSVVEKNGDRREKSCRKVMHRKKDTTCGVFSCLVYRIINTTSHRQGCDRRP